MAARKPTVLLDTSVIIAALLSSTGASAWLLHLARKKHIKLVASPYIRHEVELVIERKFPKLLARWQHLQQSHLFSRIKDASPKIYAVALAIMSHDPKDAPILAAAMAHQVDYLVTLDQKDFINDPSVTKKSRINICTPGKLIKILSPLLK